MTSCKCSAQDDPRLGGSHSRGCPARSPKDALEWRRERASAEIFAALKEAVVHVRHFCGCMWSESFGPDGPREPKRHFYCDGCKWHERVSALIQKVETGK